MVVGAFLKTFLAEQTNNNKKAKDVSMYIQPWQKKENTFLMRNIDNREDYAWVKTGGVWVISLSLP